MSTEKQMTPLQELIVFIKVTNLFNVDPEQARAAIFKKCQSLLPKEKQGIIDAYETGDKYKFEISGDKWFNEKYTQ